ALNFARFQVGEEALAVFQVDAEQADALTLPEAEAAASKVGVLEDAVEASGVLVVDVVVARRPKERRPEPSPVAVVRQFGGSEGGADVLAGVGDRVERVAAERIVQLRSQV